jgi:hypothetical protein
MLTVQSYKFTVKSIPLSIFIKKWKTRATASSGGTDKKIKD